MELMGFSFVLLWVGGVESATSLFFFCIKVFLHPPLLLHSISFLVYLLCLLKLSIPLNIWNTVDLLYCNTIYCTPIYASWNCCFYVVDIKGFEEPKEVP